MSVNVYINICIPIYICIVFKCILIRIYICNLKKNTNKDIHIHIQIYLYKYLYEYSCIYPLGAQDDDRFALPLVGGFLLRRL
jgi:hypothetical protein